MLHFFDICGWIPPLGGQCASDAFILSNWMLHFLNISVKMLFEKSLLEILP